MLDLEVVPERSVGHPEKSWEFVLGKNYSLFLCLKKKLTLFRIFRSAFLSSCSDYPNPSWNHQECSSSVQRA